MNAIHSNILRTVARQAQIRSKATVAASHIPKKLQQQTFKEKWLSDPSTYPIIVIMSCGLTFMVGMGFNALFGYKDVRINPNKRGATMQHWGQEERRGFLKRFQDVKGPHNPEGLGINHEEYAKNRAKYLKE